ncbi:MAG: DUF6206 family protein [Kofleriaceae bacterium]
MLDRVSVARVAKIDDPERLAVSDGQLRELEGRVQRALADYDDSALEVMGYGEVTVILRMRADRGDVACKRLPVFPTRERFERYRALLDDYLSRLAAAQVAVPPTRLWHMDGSDGKVIAYCLQPAFPAETVANIYLREAPPEQALEWFEAVLEATTRAVSPTVGFDVQASNWVWNDGELVYFDVTTPFLRDERGREQLDVKLFMSSMPWALREPVRVLLSRSIFDKFYTARGAILDLLGNLFKERLGDLVPLFLSRANPMLPEPITEAQVRAYYEEDARMWTLIQRLRGADRWWQRHVRRRVYPFLLPGAIAR